MTSELHPGEISSEEEARLNATLLDIGHGATQAVTTVEAAEEAQEDPVQVVGLHDPGMPLEHYRELFRQKANGNS